MEMSEDKVRLSRITVDDLDFICDIECDSELWQYEEAVQSDREVVRQTYLEKIRNDDGHHYDFIVYLEAEGIRKPIGLAQI